MDTVSGIWPADQLNRYRARVDASGGETACWPWTGPLKPDGYGQVRFAGVNDYPHRVAVKIDGRVIPDGMVVDHVCRNRACCNPAHLRVVSQMTNSIENSAGPSAENAAKKFCLRGHPLSGDNLAIQIKSGRTKRRCRRCANIYNDRRAGKEPRE